jgi:hypothetical protein
MILHDLCGHGNVLTGSHDNAKDNSVESASKRRRKEFHGREMKMCLLCQMRLLTFGYFKFIMEWWSSRIVRVAVNKCGRCCEVAKS